MAFPTAVNDQITDSITQSNTEVLGDTPATAMGNISIATSQALATAAHNAVYAQQQCYLVWQTAMSQEIGVDTILDVLSDAEDIVEVFES